MYRHFVFYFIFQTYILLYRCHKSLPKRSSSCTYEPPHDPMPNPSVAGLGFVGWLADEGLLCYSNNNPQTCTCTGTVTNKGIVFTEATGHTARTGLSQYW